MLVKIGALLLLGSMALNVIVVMIGIGGPLKTIGRSGFLIGLILLLIGLLIRAFSRPS